MENKEWLNYQQSNAIVADTNGFQELKTPDGAPSVTLPIGIKKERQKTFLKEHDYTCAYCGKVFHRTGKNIWRVKYCSLICKYQADKLKDHKGRKILTGQTFICKTCGKEFYRHPCELKKRKTNYCSFKCRKIGNYNPYRRGDKAPTWKGGIMHIQGYIYINSYDHPHKNSKGYIAEHRLVMEKELGRYLLPNEDVHHKNGIKTDNRIENLEIVIHSHHYGDVECPYCNKSFKVK